MNDNVTKLITTKSDAELANEFKDKIIKNSEPLLLILEECHKAGFDVNIGFGMNGIGKMQIGQLIISKNFVRNN